MMAMNEKMPTYRLGYRETVYVEGQVRGIIADYLATLMFKEKKIKTAVCKHFGIDEDETSLDYYCNLKSILKSEISCEFFPSLIDDIESLYQERMCEMYGYGVSRGYALALADNTYTGRRGTTDVYDEDIPY